MMRYVNTTSIENQCTRRYCTASAAELHWHHATWPEIPRVDWKCIEHAQDFYLHPLVVVVHHDARCST